MPERRNIKRLNLSAGIASVAVALTLVVLKLWALGETLSLSVAASLADNALDLMISAAGLAAILYAARPADADHAFGHTSVEDLAALGQAVLVLISAAAIFWLATGRLLAETPPPLRAESQGMAVMALSVLLTAGLVLWQRRVVHRTGNQVVAADMLHYLADLLPSLGAIAALFASARYGISDIDSLVALAAAVVLAIGAIRIGRRAWDALMDRAVDPAVIAGIEALTRGFPGVRGFHDLRTRRSGSTVFVNLHIELEGSQSLQEAHAISAALKRAIRAAYPSADVIIHKDPARAAISPEI